MNIIDSVSRFIVNTLIPPSEKNHIPHLETKTSPTVWNLLSKQYDYSLGVFPERSLDKYAQTYGMEVWVYAAVYAITSHLSSLPPLIYKLNTKGEKEYIDKGNAYNLFNFINEDDTFSDFIEKMFTYNELIGWSHAELGRRSPGSPVERLWALESWRMLPKVNNEGIEAWRYFVNGAWHQFEKEDIFYMRYFNPTKEMFGLSPVQVVYNPILRALYQEKWSMNFYKKGAVPPAVLIFPEEENVSPEEVAEVKAKWKAEYGGIDNSEEIAVLSGGMDIKLLQQTVRDMDLNNSEKSVREQILAAFGVPPIYVGILDNTKYQTSQEQQKIFWKQTLIPKKRKFETRVDSKLMPYVEEGAHIEMDTAGVDALKEDRQAQLQQYMQGIRMGAVTPNEMRQNVFGEDPSPDPACDMFYIEQGLIPIGSTRQQSEEQKKAEYEKRKIAIRERDDLSILTIPGGNGNGHDDKITKSIVNLFDVIDKIANIEIDNPYSYGSDLHVKAMQKFEAQVKPIENDFFRFWKGEVRKFVNSAIEQLNRGSVTGDNLKIDSELIARSKQRAIKLYKDIYKSTYLKAEELIEHDVKKLIDKFSKANDTGRGEQSVPYEFEDFFSEIVEDEGAIETVGYRELINNAEQAAGFNSTTFEEGVVNQLKGEVKEAIVAGEDLRSIVKRFKEKIPDITNVQANRIARTSSTLAYNNASEARYKTINERAGFNVIEGERWLATLDNRVRPDHEAAHNTMKRSGGVFKVGNENMEYPGDPSGGPAQTYNCRCTVVPVLDEEEVEQALKEQAENES